jgi:hypothetical protein
VFLAALSILSAAAQSENEVPETVMVTYQVIPGREAALKAVIARHWETARKLHLIKSPLHLIVQRNDSKNPYIVEVFTWRDGSAPDQAPQAIQELWMQMHELVEAREGRAGIDFVHVDLVEAASAHAAMTDRARH